LLVNYNPNLVVAIPEQKALFCLARCFNDFGLFIENLMIVQDSKLEYDKNLRAFNRFIYNVQNVYSPHVYQPKVTPKYEGPNTNRGAHPERINFLEQNKNIVFKRRRQTLNTTLSSFSGKNGDLGKTKYNGSFYNLENTFCHAANMTLRCRRKRRPKMS
jgi:hypothetical protein